MREPLERMVFTVVRDSGVWAVEHRGGLSGHSPSKEEARAHAARSARKVVDGGGAAEIRVHGETFFR